MTATPASSTGRSGFPVYEGLRNSGPAYVGWLAFAVAPLVLAVFWAVDLSLEGYLYGLGLFALNKAGAVLTERLARGKMEVTAVGITGTGFITRAWVSVALLFVLTRVASEEAAIAAAVCFLVLFTVDIMARSLAHLLARDAAKAQETA